MRSRAIQAMTKLLITLQFLAKGEFYSEGGLVHGVSRSTVCVSVWQVVDAINQCVNNIKFPTTQADLASIKQKFYQVARMPNCIGAVDGTLIPIIAPRVREDIYVCRKGYHAINVQAVVTPDMRFTDVVAQWPGSTHDNTIFENCGLKAWVEANNVGWLIGDAGYALKPNMLTPKIRPTTQQENAFNLAHSRTRMVVERAFGLLKSRFRCLHKTGGFFQITPEKAAKVFVVCAKLHNMCIDDAVVFDGQIHVAPDNAPPYIGALDPNAQRDRRAIIARF
ncbi:putative nuclease HARBI1 isoform X2 [Mya arenaria]|uniref:putative nuclease HARBI1 isoform X2 n=1 Tax=Mya arenaria TaxID=6604 RepID=UPI0022E8086F|nr:putative nuclease HARBI1 isoform X2 [Mya arenaria]